MGVDIIFSQAYFTLDSWVMANIVQLATQSFCDRFIDYKIDPGRRLYDQMVLAARCGVANIVEGTARYSTSIETEMRLLDVARANIEELQSDFFNFLLRRKAEVWRIGDSYRESLWKMNLDTPQYGNSLHHDAAIHILRQKSKFDPWIENPNPDVAANAILVLCVRVNRMLEAQLKSLLARFKERGGFTENMTAERLESRQRQAVDINTPKCPKCGNPMLKRTQMKGRYQGRQFWGCSAYPKCDGIRSITQD